MTEPNKTITWSPRKPIVWICHDKGGYDFTKAAVHGECRPIFKGEFNPFDLHAAWKHAADMLKADSQPCDWIIGVGSGVAQMVVTAVFISLHNRLPILVYHTKRLEYVKRELDGIISLQ